MVHPASGRIQGVAGKDGGIMGHEDDGGDLVGSKGWYDEFHRKLEPEGFALWWDKVFGYEPQPEKGIYGFQCYYERRSSALAAWIMASELDTARDLISALKSGDCWCPMGIGDPRYSDHTDTCKKIQEKIDASPRDFSLEDS